MPTIVGIISSKAAENIGSHQQLASRVCAAV